MPKIERDDKFNRLDEVRKEIKGHVRLIERRAVMESIIVDGRWKIVGYRNGTRFFVSTIIRI